MVRFLRRLSIFVGVLSIFLSTPIHAASVASWGVRRFPDKELTHLTTIAVGGHHNLALKSDGSIVSW